MSYFNFKLYTRPTKNVNTDLEYKKPNKIEEVIASTTVAFSDITDATGSGVADFKARINTLAPASFHDFIKWYGPVTNLGTTYQGVYGDSPPPSGNANFSLPLPTGYNYISITYNNPHPGGGVNAVYIFIGGAGSGALPLETALPGQEVDKINNGITGASKTYSQRYQAGDYLKIQEQTSVITNALVIKLSLLEPGMAPGWAPGNPRKGGRAPILGYRKNLDCSGATGCQNETIYKDNWAKTCATNPAACYNPVIRTIQNKGGKIDNNYNYNTRNLLRSRFRTYEQNAYNFDLRRKYASAWPTSFDLTVFAFGLSTDFAIFPGPNPQINHFDASFNLWTRPNIAFGPYNPVYQGSIDESGNHVYMTLAPSLPSIPAQNVIRWNLFKTADEKSGFENMIAYDLSHTDISGSKVYSYIVNAETDPFITTEDLTPDRVPSLFKITDWQWDVSGNHPVISNLEFALNNQPPINSVFFLKSTMSYGHLTNWGGGADVSNNAYIIHDCSCNAPFTANNPCVATYKPSNRKFAVNNAVSGRSRINRLKYNTITKVKSTKPVPFSLLGYPRRSCEFCKRDFKPSKGKKGGDDKTRINSRLPVVGGIPVPPPGVALVVEDFEAIPGLSPSYITIQYNQSLGPAPAKENFTVVNTTQVWTKMPNSTNIITTTIANDTVELEFDPPDINNADSLLLTYTQVLSPFISNPAGVVADDIIDQSITAPIGTEWKIESAVYKSGGMITTCGLAVYSDNYIEITFKTGGPVSGWATFCQDILNAPNNFIIYNSNFAQIAGGGSQESSPTGSVIQTFVSSGDGKPRVMLAFSANTRGLMNGSGDANTANRPFELHYQNGTQVPGETPEIKDTPDEITVTFETSPDPIEDLVATAGDTEVTLSWTAPGEGSSAITDYEYKIDSDPWTTTTTFPAVSYTVTGLTNGTLYHFMVRAVNTTSPFVAPDSELVHATPTQIYTKVFSGLDIYDNGELYELTATIRKVSFRVGCCNNFDYSTANQPTYDINGDLQRTMYASMPTWGDYEFEELVFWKVGFKFDKDLPSTTGIVYVDLQSDATPPGHEPTGSSSGGSGIPATLSTMTTTRIYFRGHVGAPVYANIPITALDEVKKFTIQMLDKADPNNPKVLDDSLLTDFNVLWLDPPPITDTNFFNLVDEWLNTAMSPYGLIDTWDVSSVTDMSTAFSVTRNSNAATFNDDIGSWDTSSVTNMSSMFEGAAAFNNGTEATFLWDTDLVTNMSSMFKNATSFNRRIDNIASGTKWQTPVLTNISSIFEGALAFNNGSSNAFIWYTEYVTNMSSAFKNAAAFENGNVPNGGISFWQTQNVTNMSEMFSGAHFFNVQLDGWNVNSVTNMSGMFKDATHFNNNMVGMPNNGNLWKTDGVTDMSSMFQNAAAFDQDLSTWRLDAITSGTDLSGCFNNSGLSGQTWDAVDCSGGAANSWYTKATTLDPLNFYTDGASGNNPTGAGLSQPVLTGSLIWSSFNPSVGTWQTCCCSTDGTRMAAGNFSAKVYTSVDSGVTWSEETSSFVRCESIACSADGLKLVAAKNGPTRSIGTAVDSGAGYVWEPEDTDPFGTGIGNIQSVHLASDASGNKLFATNQWDAGWDSSGNPIPSGYIYKSIDSGATWAKAGNVPPGNIVPKKLWNGITCDSTGTEIAACSYFGDIWLSHDSGANWTDSTSPASTSWIDIAYSADASVLAAVVFKVTAGVDGTIWISNDQGATWFKPTTHPVLSGAPKWYSITVSPDGSKLTCVLDARSTTDYAIWHSYDGGITWSADEANPPGTGILGKAVASSSTGNTAVMVGDSTIWVGTK